MKVNGKAGQLPLVDSKPISVPQISSTVIVSKKVALEKRKTSLKVENAVAEVSSQVIMVSKSTQTNDPNEPNVEKLRLVRKQLAALLHAVLCRVRDQLNGSTENVSSSVSVTWIK